jgi:hypothetical protein
VRAAGFFSGGFLQLPAAAGECEQQRAVSGLPCSLMTMTLPPTTGIPLEDEWANTGWEGPLALADRLTARQQAAALEALRSVFPRSLAPGLRRDRHPVVASQMTTAGRLGLLEIGLAIAAVPAGSEEIQRLRDADQYEGVVGELRVGLMFKRAGGKLRRPAAVGPHRCEYIVAFDDGAQLAIEVKTANEAERELEGTCVSYELLMALMERLAWIERFVPHARATFDFDPTILELSSRRDVGRDRFNQAVRDVVGRVWDALESGAGIRTVDLGGVGRLEIADEPSIAGVQFSAKGPISSPDEIERRLRRNYLAKASKQTRASALPGIVVLDVQRNMSARNALDLLAGWAQRQESLAALLLIDRSTVAGDQRLCGAVDILPGPRFDAAEVALASALETCADQHLHYNPLCTPSTPCPFEWLPRLA